MKILFIIDTLTDGGKERRLTELMKALKPNKDITFELAVLTKDIHFKEIFKLDIAIHYLIRKTKKDISVFFEIFKLCKKLRPDIVHCWDSMTAVYITPICRFLNIRLVNGMIVNAPDNKDINFKIWLRAKFTFFFSDIIIGNSEAGLKAYKAPLKKSIVIYNGFNFERSNNLLPIELVKNQLKIKTKFVVGMVAAFSEKKDYPTFFKAAMMILNRRKDVTFIAIGKNTDSITSRNLIDHSYLDYFRLLGSRTGIESLVNVMYIGVLTTFNEGISNSVLEYMALSKPVIATDGGGTNEIVQDKITGFLVKPSDPYEVADKIELLLNNTSLAEEMGALGKKRVNDIFSITHMTNEFISAYKKVL